MQKKIIIETISDLDQYVTCNISIGTLITFQYSNNTENKAVIIVDDIDYRYTEYIEIEDKTNIFVFSKYIYTSQLDTDDKKRVWAYNRLFYKVLINGKEKIIENGYFQTTVRKFLYDYGRNGYRTDNQVIVRTYNNVEYKECLNKVASVNDVDINDVEVDINLLESGRNKLTIMGGNGKVYVLNKKTTVDL